MKNYELEKVSNGWLLHYFGFTGNKTFIFKTFDEMIEHIKTIEGLE